MDIMMKLKSSGFSVIANEFKQRERRLGGGLPLEDFVEIVLRGLPKPKNLEEKTVTLNALVDLFNDIDINGDGTMEFDEFTSFCVDAGMVATRVKVTTLKHRYVRNPKQSFKTSHGCEGIDKLKWWNTFGALLVVETRGKSVKLFDAECKWIGEVGDLSTAQVNSSLPTNPREIDGEEMIFKSQRDSEAELEAFLAENVATTQASSNPSNALAVPSRHRAENGSGIFILDAVFLDTPQFKMISMSTTDFAITFYDMHDFPRSTLIKPMTITTQVAQLVLRFCPRSSLLMTSGNDFVIYVWKVEENNKVLWKRLIHHQELILDMLEIPAHDVLVSCDLSRVIMLWDSHDCRPRGNLAGHTHGVRQMVYSTTNDLLLSAGYEFEAFGWDIASRQLVMRLVGHRSPLIGIQLVPFQNERAVTVDSNGVLKLWDISRGNGTYAIQLESIDPTRELTRFEPKVFVSLFPSRDVIAANTAMHAFRSIRVQKYDEIPIKAFYHYSANKFIVVCGPICSVWNGETGTLSEEFTSIVGDSSQVLMCTSDAMHKKLILATESGEIGVYNCLNMVIMRKCRERLGGNGGGASTHKTKGFDQESNSGPERLGDLPVVTRASSSVVGLHYCSENKLIIACDSDQAAILIIDDDSSATAKETSVLRRVKNIPGGICASAFSFNASMIATIAEADGMLTLWDFETLAFHATCQYSEDENQKGSSLQVIEFWDPFPVLIGADVYGAVYFFALLPLRQANTGHTLHAFLNGEVTVASPEPADHKASEASPTCSSIADGQVPQTTPPPANDATKTFMTETGQQQQQQQLDQQSVSAPSSSSTPGANTTVPSPAPTPSSPTSPSTRQHTTKREFAVSCMKVVQDEVSQQYFLFTGDENGTMRCWDLTPMVQRLGLSKIPEEKCKYLRRGYQPKGIFTRDFLEDLKASRRHNEAGGNNDLNSLLATSRLSSAHDDDTRASSAISTAREKMTARRKSKYAASAAGRRSSTMLAPIRKPVNPEESSKRPSIAAFNTTTNRSTKTFGTSPAKKPIKLTFHAATNAVRVAARLSPTAKAGKALQTSKDPSEATTRPSTGSSCRTAARGLPSTAPIAIPKASALSALQTEERPPSSTRSTRRTGRGRVNMLFNSPAHRRASCCWQSQGITLTCWWQAHHDSITSIELNQHPHVVVTCSYDMRVFVWNWQGRCLGKLFDAENIHVLKWRFERNDAKRREEREMLLKDITDHLELSQEKKIQKRRESLVTAQQFRPSNAYMGEILMEQLLNKHPELSALTSGIDVDDDVALNKALEKTKHPNRHAKLDMMESMRSEDTAVALSPTALALGSPARDSSPEATENNLATMSTSLSMPQFISTARSSSGDSARDINAGVSRNASVTRLRGSENNHSSTQRNSTLQKLTGDGTTTKESTSSPSQRGSSPLLSSPSGRGLVIRCENAYANGAASAVNSSPTDTSNHNLFDEIPLVSTDSSGEGSDGMALAMDPLENAPPPNEDKIALRKQSLANLGPLLCIDRFEAKQRKENTKFQLLDTNEKIFVDLGKDFLGEFRSIASNKDLEIPALKSLKSSRSVSTLKEKKTSRQALQELDKPEHTTAQAAKPGSTIKESTEPGGLGTVDGLEEQAPPPWQTSRLPNDELAAVVAMRDLLQRKAVDMYKNYEKVKHHSSLNNPKANKAPGEKVDQHEEEEQEAQLLEPSEFLKTHLPMYTSRKPSQATPQVDVRPQTAPTGVDGDGNSRAVRHLKKYATQKIKPKQSTGSLPRVLPPCDLKRPATAAASTSSPAQMADPSASAATTAPSASPPKTLPPSFSTSSMSLVSLHSSPSLASLHSRTSRSSLHKDSLDTLFIDSVAKFHSKVNQDLLPLPTTRSVEPLASMGSTRRISPSNSPVNGRKTIRPEVSDADPQESKDMDAGAPGEESTTNGPGHLLPSPSMRLAKLHHINGIITKATTLTGESCHLAMSARSQSSTARSQSSPTHQQHQNQAGASHRPSRHLQSPLKISNDPAQWPTETQAQMWRRILQTKHRVDCAMREEDNASPSEEERAFEEQMEALRQEADAQVQSAAADAAAAAHKSALHDDSKALLLNDPSRAYQMRMIELHKQQLQVERQKQQKLKEEYLYQKRRELSNNIGNVFRHTSYVFHSRPTDKVSTKKNKKHHNKTQATALRLQDEEESDDDDDDEEEYDVEDEEDPLENVDQGQDHGPNQASPRKGLTSKQAKSKKMTKKAKKHKKDKDKDNKKNGIFGNYSAGEVMSVIRLFWAMDEDNSGSISESELLRFKKFFEKLGYNDMVTVFQTIDRDGSNGISLKELLQVCFHYATKIQLDEMLKLAKVGNVQAFLRGLNDTSGTVGSADNAEDTALTEEQKEELLEIFHLFDKNHDGGVSVEEIFDALQVDEEDEQELQAMSSKRRSIVAASSDGDDRDAEDDEAERREERFGTMAATAFDPPPNRPIRGLTKHDITKLYSEYDTNGNKSLDFNEFINLMKMVYGSTPIFSSDRRSTAKGKVTRGYNADMS